MSLALSQLQSISAAKRLSEAGITDAQFAKARFSLKHRNSPFDEWPFTWPAELNLEKTPSLLLDLRIALTHRWLLGLDQPASSAAEAWQFLAITEAGQAVELSRRFRDSQRRKASRERGVIAELEATMGAFIGMWSCKPDNLLLDARELYPAFFGELDARGLNPKSKDGRLYYDYNDERRSIRYNTFAAHVRKARKAKAAI